MWSMTWSKTPDTGAGEKLRGTNLGNWLVLEKWMQPAMFAGTDAEDEAGMDDGDSDEDDDVEDDDSDDQLQMGDDNRGAGDGVSGRLVRQPGEGTPQG